MLKDVVPTQEGGREYKPMACDKVITYERE